eukprot:1630626-Lingulodinium_polyedra.AAC.1
MFVMSIGVSDKDKIPTKQMVVNECYQFYCSKYKQLGSNISLWAGGEVDWQYLFGFYALVIAADANADTVLESIAHRPSGAMKSVAKLNIRHGEVLEG